MVIHFTENGEYLFNTLKTDCLLNNNSIDSWCNLLDYCPICRKYLGDDFPYDIKLMYKDSSEKHFHEKTDHLLKKFKESNDHIEEAEGLYKKIKTLHEIYEELKSFFDSEDNSD